MLEQNWDYLFLKGEDGRPRYVNGREIPNWQEGPSLAEAVTRLIWKGWIPIANPYPFAGVGNSTLQLALIFRRPKKQ